ncbi:ribonuclease P [Haloarcula sp. S1CR25-12]|uniref:Ribonuclease P protein component 2 n=1 Tax=Haloarcula saliterrae TaxID=2950534 RepID=A0ABU2F7L9_9EURY|nr:Rpp14/Pop5 family protein [Haloarcula sp. S1CR25-12]MDS0258229.1 ribonuclease P [Haloarcula sp. S1CR25-12]
MKHLPKHLQPRWRYLAVAIETWPDADLDRRSFQREAWYAAQNLLGDTGSAETDMTVVRFDHDDGLGHAIVRVRRGHTDQARAALACIDGVDGDPLGLRVSGTSGTVRACEEKYIRGPAKPPEQRHVVFDNRNRRAVARDGRVDVHTDGGFVGATDLDI